jgi:hypothetical protein
LGTSQTTIFGTLTNPTNLVQTATYTVTPTSGTTGNCVGATFTVTVTVNPKPVIPAQTATICSATAFTTSPANAAPTTIVPSGTNYTWTVATNANVTGQSDQLTAQTNISQTLTNLTNTVQTVVYTVTPTSGAAGTCVGATFTITVTVNPRPEIPNQTATICSGATFTTSLTNGNPSATTIVPASTKYTWTVATNANVSGQSNQAVGQTNISQTLTNLTNTVQTVVYTVTPTSGAAGSCVGPTFTVTVTVNPKPVIPAQTATICSSNAFTTSPVNAAPTTIVPSGTTYTWTVAANANVTGQSDQTIAQTNISQTLTNSTNTAQTVIYTVTPTSGDAGNCVGATFTITVTVNPKPYVSTQTTSACSASTFTVSPANGTTSNIVPASTTYAWSAPVVTGGITGGVAATGQTTINGNLTNPTNIVQTAIYTVTPTSGSAGNCVGETFTVTVSINPKPFVTPRTETICSGGSFATA